MPYNFIADRVHAKKLCSRLSSSEVEFYTENGSFAFLSPPGDFGATYDVHPRLIGKRVVDFLLVLIELIFAFCYGRVGMSEYRLKIDIFTPTGSVWAKISGSRGRSTPTVLLARKLGE